MGNHVLQNKTVNYTILFMSLLFELFIAARFCVYHKSYLRGGRKRDYYTSKICSVLRIGTDFLWAETVYLEMKAVAETLFKWEILPKKLFQIIFLFFMSLNKCSFTFLYSEILLIHSPYRI